MLPNLFFSPLLPAPCPPVFKSTLIFVTFGFVLQPNSKVCLLGFAIDRFTQRTTFNILQPLLNEQSPKRFGIARDGRHLAANTQLAAR